MLFRRYSDPIALLNMMIRAGRFYDFLCEIVDIQNEETGEQVLWDIWLHKVFGQSYADFRDSLGDNSKPEDGETNTEKVDLATLLKQSEEILSFVPPDVL